MNIQDSKIHKVVERKRFIILLSRVDLYHMQVGTAARYRNQELQLFGRFIDADGNEFIADPDPVARLNLQEIISGFDVNIADRISLVKRQGIALRFDLYGRKYGNEVGVN